MHTSEDRIGAIVKLSTQTESSLLRINRILRQIIIPCSTEGRHTDDTPQLLVHLTRNMFGVSFPEEPMEAFDSRFR